MSQISRCIKCKRLQYFGITESSSEPCGWCQLTALQAQVTELKEQEEHGQKCWEAQCEDLTQAEAQVAQLKALLQDASDELKRSGRLLDPLYRAEKAEAQVVKLTDLLREAYEELNHAKLADTPLGADLAAVIAPEGV